MWSYVYVDVHVDVHIDVEVHVDVDIYIYTYIDLYIHMHIPAFALTLSCMQGLCIDRLSYICTSTYA